MKPLILVTAWVTTMLINFSMAHAEQGGITAGGGGTTNPNPVESSGILSAIYGSKLLLTSLLQAQEEMWEMFYRRDGSKDDKLRFLFDRTDNVFKYLDKVVIEPRSSAPCQDALGNKVDGSIYASQAGAICISTFTLGKKLSSLNYEYETAALILHEIVHQMGGDEALAQNIQTLAAYGLARTTFNDLRIDYGMLRRDLTESAKEVEILKSSTEWQNPSSGYQHAFDRLLSLSDQLSRNFNTHPMKFAIRRTFDGTLVKLLVIQSYALSADSKVDEGVRKMEAERYLKGFGVSEKLSLADYLFNRDGIRSSRYNWTTVTRIKTQEQWKAELQDIIDILYRTSDSVDRLMQLRFSTVEVK